jgi:hypothetical protein
MPDDDRIPDDALVVRGGNVTAEQLRLGCAQHTAHPEIFKFSVQSDQGASVADLARAGEVPTTP